MSEQKRTLDLRDDATGGLALVGGGMAFFLLGWIVGSRVLRILGFLAAAGGAGLYAKARISDRSEKIDAAESHIRSELEDLDPLAKAEVIAKLAQNPPD